MRRAWEEHITDDPIVSPACWTKRFRNDRLRVVIAIADPLVLGRDPLEAALP
jgi:hypothetical protein